MALTSTTPTHAPASKSAASALPGPRAPAKARFAKDDDAADDFAAQLQLARPAEAKAPEADAQPAADDAAHAASKPAKDKDATPDAPAQPATDNGALQWAQQQLAAAGTDKAAPADAGDLAKGIAALRKGALAGKDGKAALADSALTAKAAVDTGAAAARDADAVLGQGFGAGNSATATRDSLAALLPQADAALSVQAGAVGANPNASLDVGQAAAQASAPAPAQATLAMPPQSPAFAPALGQQIEVWMRDGVQHAEVQLSPKDLGPIRVKISVEGADTRIEMHADVASTRDALQQALPQLSDSLGEVGLALTGGGVSDQSASQSQARAGEDAAQGGSGRTGASRSRSGGDIGGDALDSVAAAARPAAQRRGLLDMYA